MSNETTTTATEHELSTESGKRWYVINTYSGYEDKVKRDLQHRVDTMGFADKIEQILVPTVEEIEIRNGQRHTVQRKVYPGYVLVLMEMDDSSWYVVRNTPGVTSFVGFGNKPTPLEEREVNRILKRMDEEPPKVKMALNIGEAVRITDGPFADFEGTVDDVNEEKGKVKVLISIFGRSTPVELDFLQVEKIVA
ncbi:MAG: transcription termination/antitermination protein NusG [Chloroflexota bacterium]|nr:transcription termination/antitermination protein NusG [Chloroflexota bacterium]